MTVGRSNATMSEKSRLESLEKSVTHLRRELKETNEDKETLADAVDELLDTIEKVCDSIFALEQTLNSHISGDK